MFIYLGASIIIPGGGGATSRLAGIVQNREMQLYERLFRNPTEFTGTYRQARCALNCGQALPRMRTLTWEHVPLELGGTASEDALKSQGQLDLCPRGGGGVKNGVFQQGLCLEQGQPSSEALSPGISAPAPVSSPVLRAAPPTCLKPSSFFLRKQLPSLTPPPRPTNNARKSPAAPGRAPAPQPPPATQTISACR